MIRTLIIEEIRRLRFERVFIGVLILLGMLSAYASWSGQQWQNLRHLASLAQIEILQAETNREAREIEKLERGELTITEAAAAGLPHLVRTELVLPVLPTAGLAIGSAELRPTHAAISATTRAHEMFRFQEVDNPVLLGWGRFDLAFLIAVLLPLFILLTSCTALSREQAQGSLGFLLSHPVTARQVGMVRVGLRSVALLSALIAGAGLGALGWTIVASASVAGGVALADAMAVGGVSPALRGVMFFFATICNVAFWTVLALWIVSRNQSSDQLALRAVMLWIFLVLIVPAVLTATARLASPTPSRLEYITTAREAENVANQEGRTLLAQYLLDHPELEATRGEAVAPFIKTFVLVQRQVDVAVGPVVERFRRSEEAQRKLADSLRWLSPRELVERSLLASSGHDLQRFSQFERQAERLRDSWRDAVQGPLIEGRRLSRDEFLRLPRQQFMEVDHRDVAGDFFGQLAVLLSLAIFIGWIALRNFARFSPVSVSEQG